MKTCSACKVEKPLTEFYRRPANRDGRRGDCKLCTDAKVAKWQEANPDKVRAAKRKYDANNKEKVSEMKKRWQYANRKRMAELVMRYARKNPDKVAARNAAWTKENLAWCAAKNARRHAAKLQATPAWANEFFISEAYDLAARRTKATGFKWHVDHVVPLQSKLVCGLHVENNLQVIPATVNLSKHNKHWPDMPERRQL